MSKTITDVKSRVHQTSPGARVRARAIIGDGQKGAWVMLLDGGQKAGGIDDRWVDLGDGASLAGKDLEVSAVLMDVRPLTNRLILTVEVEGPTPTTVEISNVGDAGDSAAYSAIVFFQ